MRYFIWLPIAKHSDEIAQHAKRNSLTCLGFTEMKTDQSLKWKKMEVGGCCSHCENHRMLDSNPWASTLSHTQRHPHLVFRWRTVPLDCRRYLSCWPSLHWQRPALEDLELDLELRQDRFNQLLLQTSPHRHQHCTLLLRGSRTSVIWAF